MLEGLPEVPPSTRELRDILAEDTTLHWLRLKNEDTPLNRRAYIRAAFAFMEGFVAVLKQHTLAELKAGRTSLTPGELALLLEVSHTASEQGQPVARPSYVPLPQNIRFAFAAFAKAHNTARTPDYTNHRWRSLLDAVKVRNRITHPRTAADLEVADSELAGVEQAWLWFLDATFAVFVEGRASLMIKLGIEGAGAVTPPVSISDDR